MWTGRGIVRFGPFVADLGTGELRRGKEAVELQDLPFKVLALLLQKPGQLVTRQELRASLWPPGVFVDFEHGLNKAMNKIRRALGETGSRPRYIETLPRRGYRFIASIEEAAILRAACRILWDDRTILLQHGVNMIGRDPQAAVWVDSSTVSRHHARIVVSDDGALLEDLGSKNGTFLRDRRIDAPEKLTDGDEIVVGSARMIFRTLAGTQSTETAAR